MELPNVSMVKVIIYKTTVVYRDPLTSVQVATLPAGREVDGFISFAGWLGVVYQSPLNIGFVKVNDVIIEADTLRQTARLVVAADVRTGPAEAFPVVFRYPAGQGVNVFQRGNGFLRIGDKMWIPEGAVGAQRGERNPNKFPWVPVLIGVGATLGLVTIVGLVRWRKPKVVKKLGL